MAAAILDHNGEDKACWRHSPVYNSLSIDAVEGQIDEIFVDCERRSASLAVEDDVTWNIPESWGSCRLRVYGDVGTRFQLIEYGNSPEE